MEEKTGNKEWSEAKKKRQMRGEKESVEAPNKGRRGRREGVKGSKYSAE